MTVNGQDSMCGILWYTAHGDEVAYGVSAPKQISFYWYHDDYMSGNGTAWGSYFNLVEDTSSGGSSEGDDGTDSGTAPAEFAGTYSYTAASGTSQKSGSLTFAENGTYTYSGSATSVAAANGTWSMSGDKLTVRFTASGQDVEAVFTVSENGNSVTFTADTKSDYITFLSSYFGVVSETTITFTKSE